MGDNKNNRNSTKESDVSEDVINGLTISDLRRLLEYLRVSHPNVLQEAFHVMNFHKISKSAEQDKSKKEPKQPNTKQPSIPSLSFSLQSKSVKKNKESENEKIETTAAEPQSKEAKDVSDYNVPISSHEEENPEYEFEYDVEADVGIEAQKQEQKFEQEQYYQDQLSTQIGCYLVYDPSSNGRLMIYYSKSYIPNSVGFWSPGPGEKIQEFKFKKNLGRSELIGNCAAGVTGRKNYYSGWCQFIRAAKALKGSVTIFPRNDLVQGLDVDIFVYYKSDEEIHGHQTVQIPENAAFDLRFIAAVACLPKQSTLFDELAKIELNHWMTVSSKVGAASAFTDSESTADAALLAHLLKCNNYEPSKYDLQAFTREKVSTPKATSPTNIQRHSPTPTLNTVSTSESSASPIETTGCYMLYNTDGAKLILHYSRNYVENALGFWQPGPGKSIQGFKFKQHHGKVDLQTNCASGVTGRKNYYSGLCQFIRAAKVLDGTVTIYDKGDKPGLDVDVYVYYINPQNDTTPQTLKVEDDTPLYTGGINAVCCLPKYAEFFEDNLQIDLNHWMTVASSVGAASRFEG